MRSVKLAGQIISTLVAALVLWNLVRHWMPRAVTEQTSWLAMTIMLGSMFVTLALWAVRSELSRIADALEDQVYAGCDDDPDGGESLGFDGPPPSILDYPAGERVPGASATIEFKGRKDRAA